MRRNNSFLIAILVIGMSLSCGSLRHYKSSNQENRCEYWKSKIDPSLPLMGKGLWELPIDEESISAIECLLQLEGRREPANIGGVTRFDVSKIIENQSIEIAALYYITFIYSKKWDHASAIAIVAANGEINTPDIINKAFLAYKEWFKTVKIIGLEKARRQKLEPLKDTDLHWYR